MPTSKDKAVINQLINEHKLPLSYLSTVEFWLAPIAEELAKEIHTTKNTEDRTKFVLGVQGAQGSGKSTCSDFFKALFEHHYDLKTAVLSIDDFYLTRAERENLGQTVHPLLTTRGVPGTHDVKLAIETIDNLIRLQSGQCVKIPRFNKAVDDRADVSAWDSISDPVDIIILEGWFTGLTAADETTLKTPINSLETDEDPNAYWRNYVNQSLASEYQDLYAKLNALIVLKAPSFDCIYNWRLKQEQKLIEKVKLNPNMAVNKTLTPEQVKHFVAHFERLTNHALATLPNQADWCLHLDENQKVVRLSGQRTKKQFIIFTDLDGTLMDHHTYSWQAAVPAMQRAINSHTPIVINTSKTADEVIALQKHMSILEPFICENGSALFIPQSQTALSELIKQSNDTTPYKDYIQVTFGATREQIIHDLYSLRKTKQYQFEGYTDWTVEQLMEKTGLDQQAATQSQQRQFSEPLIWSDTAEQFETFKHEITQLGYQILKGGRFVHILGKTNKAKPMLYLIEQMSKLNFKAYQSICLGDSPNDIDMLNVADYAVCVKSPTGKYPALNNPNFQYQTQGYGPEGWNEAITKIMT